MLKFSMDKSGTDLLTTLKQGINRKTLSVSSGIYNVCKFQKYRDEAIIFYIAEADPFGF